MQKGPRNALGETLGQGLFFGCSDTVEELKQPQISTWVHRFTIIMSKFGGASVLSLMLSGNAL